jgi:Carboxypeptidase regulatory-like domain
LKNTGLTLKECTVKTGNRQVIDFGGNIKDLQGVLIRTLAIGILFVLVSASLHGQQITGTIVGSVKDAQGAVLPGAVVKATNVDTQFSRSTTTGSEGEYRIEYLPVGKYTVDVEASGFKKFVQQNVVLAVDQTQPLNVILAVGTQTETVTVTEAPSLIDTNTAVLGRTVQQAEIIGLPLVNRNAYTELSLTPGVQSNSASALTNPSGTPNYVIGVPSTQVVVNGGIDGGVPMVSFFLDGGNNMTGIRNYGNPLPNPDAL